MILVVFGNTYITVIAVIGSDTFSLNLWSLVDIRR